MIPPIQTLCASFRIPPNIRKHELKFLHVGLRTRNSTKSKAPFWMQLNMPNSVTSTRNRYPRHPLPAAVQSLDAGLGTPHTKARVADHASTQRNNVFLETMKKTVKRRKKMIY